MAPPWVACGHCSCGPASLADCLENHLLWVDSVPAVTISHHAVCPLEFPLSFIWRWSLIVVYCLHLHILHCFILQQLFIYTVLQWFILHCLIPFVQLFHPQLQFDYCLIIVHYSDLGNVFRVFWSRNKKTLPIIIKYSQASKHHTSTRLTYFHLRIGFSKIYCHNRR
jgi:hypothetical protein